MSGLLPVAAAAAWLSLPIVILRVRVSLRHTTLAGLWLWLAATWGGWGLAGWAGMSLDSPGAIDLGWYTVAILSLVPPVAVLGARRPIHRTWPWFVLLPLVGVFAWPAFSAMSRGWPPAPWTLEEPLLVGYGLVLVMGSGNYLGLRNTVPALLWIAAQLLLVGVLCPATQARLPPAWIVRSSSTLLVAASAWLASRTVGRRADSDAPGGAIGFDRAWLDFRETFGIVWTRRVQERFNEGMRLQSQPVRLGMQGLEPVDPQSSTPIEPYARQVAETSLRWLLLKFVDPEWIDARLAGAIR